jgi:pyroglutamyl-peptidase
MRHFPQSIFRARASRAYPSCMQTILVTGFEPFGGDAVNPSLEAIRVLAAWHPERARLVVAPLPVSRYRIRGALRDALSEHRPDVVIAVGQAASRAEMSVERVAINLDDFRIPDNEGVQPVDEPVVAGGPVAYLTPLPVKAMVARMREAGVPAQVSHTAGTFLCNHVFYLLCHLAATQFPGMRCGFIHVPGLPEQAALHPGHPSMSLETIIVGIKAAITAVREIAVDLHVSEGQTH